MCDPEGNGDRDKEEGGWELSFWRCLGRYPVAKEWGEGATGVSLYEWDLKARTFSRLHLVS